MVRARWGAEGKSTSHTPARVRGCHSPFPVPDLRDQLLVTLAQGWLLVCAHQAATLQEELGQRRAGGPGQWARSGEKRRGAWHRLESWVETQKLSVWQVLVWGTHCSPPGARKACRLQGSHMFMDELCPPTSYVGSPNPQDLRMWLYSETGSLKRWLR